MSFRIIFPSGIILLSLAMSGCAPRVESLEHTPTSSPPTTLYRSGESETLNKVITDLTHQGGSVQIGGIIQQPFFSPQGKLIRIDGEEIQVYIYSDSDERLIDSGSISSDGTIIGQINITWIEQPYFWAYEDLIVLYMGSNSVLITQISKSLGEPIAQPDPPEEGAWLRSEFPLAISFSIQDLSTQLDFPMDQIEVISFESIVWPDSCLGISKSGQMCLQVLTPGYKIILSAEGNQYQYHSDEIGQKIELVNDIIPENE